MQMLEVRPDLFPRYAVFVFLLIATLSQFIAANCGWKQLLAVDTVQLSKLASFCVVFCALYSSCCTYSASYGQRKLLLPIKEETPEHHHQVLSAVFCAVEAAKA